MFVWPTRSRYSWKHFTEQIISPASTFHFAKKW